MLTNVTIVRPVSGIAIEGVNVTCQPMLANGRLSITARVTRAGGAPDQGLIAPILLQPTRPQRGPDGQVTQVADPRWTPAIAAAVAALEAAVEQVLIAEGIVTPGG
jgi:hypothetical protein